MMHLETSVELTKEEFLVVLQESGIVSDGKKEQDEEEK